MALSPRVTEVERLLFRSDVVAVGAFRSSADHPLFADPAPASGHLLVFPRTSTTIACDRGGAVTVGPPTVLFYNSGQSFKRRRIDRVHAADWYMIAPDVVRDAVSRYDAHAADRESRIFPFFTAPAGARLYLAQRRLHNALNHSSDALAVEESVISILHDALRAAGNLAKTREECRRDAVEAVKAMIAARPFANPALRSLAAAAGCSPFRLCRSFHQATGSTITQYRHALRLRLALAALLESKSELTDIALDLGYSSHSHFTMAFRRHFGVTPSDYRRNEGLTATQLLSKTAGRR